MRIGSAFSGIGGIELGLESCGLGPVVWQIEWNSLARDVLVKHWPNAQRFDDIEELDTQLLAPIGILCGGFPCQDTSQAGKGWRGMRGNKSSRWRYMVRIAKDLRPDFVFIEHPTSGLRRWLDTVLEDLHACGYDAEWDTFTAAECGAPHLRERTFILARHANCDRKPIVLFDEQTSRLLESAIESWTRGIPESGIVRLDDGFPVGLARSQLEMLGNACVPLQAAHAYRILATRYADAASKVMEVNIP